MRCLSTLFSGLALGLIVTAARGQDSVPKVEPKPARDAQTLHKELAQKLTRIKLIGQFTITGKEGPLAKEEYHILSAKKLEQGDLWLLNARIKYGNHDVTVPIPLEIKWAGETPVITLDKLTIPGLGTFSSRVLFHEKSYAGTWSHDNVGGHLFGSIEKLADEP